MLVAYVKNRCTPRRVRDLKATIASMPEVEAYSWMSKESVLYFFEFGFGGDTGSPAPSIPIIPFPQGFWILLRQADQADSVVERLSTHPAVQPETGGAWAFDGIEPASEFYQRMDRINRLPRE